MVQRTPLVVIGGEVKELPAGDTISDAGAQKLHGFPNRTDTTLSYGFYNVTVTAVSGTVKYWFKGVLVDTGQSSVSASVSEGGMEPLYVYFADATGVLTASTAAWDLEQHVPVATFLSAYSNFLADERHCAQRDPLMHKYLHLTQGAKKVSGFAVSSYVIDDGATQASLRLTVDTGTVADEDILVSATAVSTGGYTHMFQSNNAGAWAWASGNADFYRYATYATYDAAGSNTPLVSGELVNVWVIGTTMVDPALRVMFLQGQQKYTSLGAALNESLDDVSFATFPIIECVPLYRITLSADSSYTTNGKVAIAAVVAVSRDYKPARLSTDYVDIVAEPSIAAPSKGHVRLFGKQFCGYGGRVIPAAVGPSGMDYTLQPALWRQKVRRWNAAGGTTTVPGVDGMAVPTALGTATARALAATTFTTRLSRLGYVSAATAGGFAGWYVNSTHAVVGNGSGLGGFFYSTRFAFSDAAAVAGVRAFVGLSSSIATPTNVEPSTLTNCFGVAQLSTNSTQLYLVYGGSAAQSAVALGTGFPPFSGTVGPTTGVPYDLTLWCPPNANGVVYWQLERLDTGAVTSGVVTPATPGTQTPANTTFLSPRVWRCNNATALACAVDIIGLYLETDY